MLKIFFFNYFMDTHINRENYQYTYIYRERERENSPSDSNKNSRALPLSHLIVGRISKTCFENQIPNSKTIFMNIQAKNILDLLMNLNGNLDTFLPWVHLSFGYSLITDLKKILDLYLFINTTKVYRHTKLASFEETNSKCFWRGTFIDTLRAFSTDPHLQYKRVGLAPSPDGVDAELGAGGGQR